MILAKAVLIVVLVIVVSWLLGAMLRNFRRS